LSEFQSWNSPWSIRNKFRNLKGLKVNRTLIFDAADMIMPPLPPRLNSHPIYACSSPPYLRQLCMVFDQKCSLKRKIWSKIVKYFNIQILSKFQPRELLESRFTGGLITSMSSSSIRGLVYWLPLFDRMDLLWDNENW